MSRLPDNYINILARLKEQIQKARMKAALSANAVLLHLYWEIGLAIIEMQQAEGWGSKVIDRLSSDLKADFPDFKGLSVRNLKYMVRFAKTFPAFGQQTAAQNENTEKKTNAIGQQPAAQLPWGHLQVLMDKVTKPNELLFYMQKCVENGWSRNILVEQIKSGLYDRQGKAITNFSKTLPTIHSDLAKQTLKNPYLFDFLGLGEEARERELENALIQHLKHFMLELGRGFAYVGRQKNLAVEGDDFFLDLLFYNYNLHCFMVIELKVANFKPEFAGKLNFYVNTVNEQIKGPDDKPTIGVLLCKTPNETVVRYSLQGIESPIGVAEYQLSAALPKNLRGEIPSVEELEAEVDKEIQELKKPTEKKLEQIKVLMRGLNQPPVQQKRNPANIGNIFRKIVLIIRDNIKEALDEISKEFQEIKLELWIDQHGYEWDEAVNKWLNENRETNEFRISIRLMGCKPAGINAFDIWKDLTIHTNIYKYTIGFDRNNPQEILIEKLYHQLPNQQEFEMIVEKVTEAIYDEMEQKLKSIIPK